MPINHNDYILEDGRTARLDIKPKEIKRPLSLFLYC